MARVCSEPGCPELAVDGRHCRSHRTGWLKRKQEQRGEAGKRAQQWYTTRRWAKRRAQQLARFPHCQCPDHDGKQVPADTVDHVEPHRGNPRKFWYGKLQSLTRHCHSSWKQRLEREKETGGGGG